MVSRISRVDVSVGLPGRETKCTVGLLDYISAVPLK
jgi:hypothetical protein